MTTIASKIPQTNPNGVDLCDTTPPPKLDVAFAAYGDIRLGSTNVDPLVLTFHNVEPGTKLQYINLSENPAATWDSDAKTFPGDTSSCGREYSLVFDNKEADKLGIKPGDVFQVRQVDAAGNASPGTLIYLLNEGKGYRYDNRRLAQHIDTFGESLPAGIAGRTVFSLTTDKDSRPPVVVSKQLSITPVDSKSGQLVVDRGIEPGATVYIVNQRTGKEFSELVNDEGKLSLEFDANPGDPLCIYVIDHNSQKTDLGSVVYAPTSIPAGLACGANLQKACA